MAIRLEEVNDEVKGNSKEDFDSLRKEIEELKKRSLPEKSDKDSSLTEELLKRIPIQSNDSISSFEGYSDFDHIDLDEEDVLPEDEQVTFVSHHQSYVIVDAVINNRPVRVPYNKPIIFDYEATRQVKNGKEVDIFNISTYRCKSRKILKFLKKHPLYRIKFFDNLNAIKTTDARMAEKLASAMNSLKNYGGIDLHQMCQQRGIPSSKDLSVMRASLAFKIAEEAMINEEKKNEIRTRDARIEEALLSDSK